jgi:excinuclease ABC subunit B
MTKPPPPPPPPDEPAKPPRKRKDPARPTRAKAAREALPPIAPALADLLNPAINRGEAGVGSQTGLGRPSPSSPGLQPPPDNSRDRRADSAAAAGNQCPLACQSCRLTHDSLLLIPE